ncbi:GSCOCT00014117001.2-RA-CDS, partial [Cotesia congregata]
KGLTLWFYRHDLFTIVRDFLTLWNCNQTKTNLLNNINSLIKSSKRVRYYYMFTIMLIGTSFGLRPLIIIFTYCVSSSRQSNSTFDFSVVVYPLAYPFTYQTVSRYSLLLLYEEFVNYFAVCYVICDALYIQLMTHISINFLVKYIKTNFSILLKKNYNLRLQELNYFCIFRFWLMILIIICEKVESFYNPIVFFTIVMNGLDLCLCVIVIDKEIAEGNWTIVIKSFVHAVALFVQIIMYCNFSHTATEMTASIKNSIYNSEWVNNSNKFKKMIMMIMMRTSKEYKFTAYGILVLNREQMAKVIQTTMSYFTLLRSFT